ncbi:MAG: hypothetical protein HY914_08655 [Desulfomonile tiedjei]|nr:hypothetical protein [Desulfomonile tiedjei]
MTKTRYHWNGIDPRGGSHPRGSLHQVLEIERLTRILFDCVAADRSRQEEWRQLVAFASIVL